MEQELEVVSETLPAKGVQLKAHHKSEWVRRFKESGLSLREFSRQHGLRCGSLCRWVNKELEARLVPAAPAFVELKLPRPALEPPKWLVELSLANGNILRMAGEVPAAILEQLLRAC